VSAATGTLDRLELRLERLQLTFRFTYAFHAREVRFECDRGQGFERLFPETFSFHVESHDPAELYLQLDDLASKPALLAPGARQRDIDLLAARLLLAVPRYLEGILDRLGGEGGVDADASTRVHTDLALLSQILVRFVEERLRSDDHGLRIARFHLRKLLWRSLMHLVDVRVSGDYLSAYMQGSVDPVDPADDLSEAGLFHTLSLGDQETVDRSLLRLAERAFYRWVEDVCLDTANGAFEAEDSPFDTREAEVMRAICGGGAEETLRTRDLVPFLRRPGNRDCLRVLSNLQGWFLRVYDIQHAASMIYHADRIALRETDGEGDRVLSRHTTNSYLLALSGIASPFVGAAFFYDRAPAFFDVLCSAEAMVVNAVALWFLVWRFLWKKNLSFFHAAVPRIAAGIIVGYLPIFFIDEVWGLASRPFSTLIGIVALLGMATLLYLYVEVQSRLGDPQVAFQRARQIFLLGVLQATGIGILLTGLVGRYMALRNWSNDPLADGRILDLRDGLTPFLGELPRIVGVEPFYVFPAAVLVMALMSFFIGTFLQLMWEDIPITEPL
jgi:hypothetical protein